MPVGVPEQAVFDAADRVLARGERPTTERVRVELGRGSPARVGQLLEQWWEALAKRLAGETRLPELPPAVAEAFRTVWATAADQGQSLAEANFAQAAAELADAQRHLANERTAMEEVLETAQFVAATATDAKNAADARMVDLQRLLDHQASQLADVTVQREELRARVAHLEQAVIVAETALAALHEQSAQEREALLGHMRAVEDRANAEVDRARQDSQELQAQLTESTKKHAAIERSLREASDRAKDAANDASRIAGAERARADAIEVKWVKLQDLPAVVEAAIRRNETLSKQEKSKRKKATTRKTSREFRAAVKKV